MQADPSRDAASAQPTRGRSSHRSTRSPLELVFNTVSMIQDAALAGFGIAHLPQDQVQTHLDRGELVRLLADWCPPFPGYHVYYPSRRRQLAAFEVLVEALRHRD